ncbi:hypothetical protein NQ318_002086 [Aromia moschata]|uniref:CREG-like beta-barrel domain-containing protein n=1 Tax=Aromia moschata TaxID=1265417 RepID=A0AAV8X8D1_9CUCU|nr:hypothetical protein NQ318_002086 [Aromia moschata]
MFHLFCSDLVSRKNSLTFKSSKMHMTLGLLLSILSMCGLYSCAVIPKIDETTTPAQVAKYIVHNSDWVSVASISVQRVIKGYPYVSLESVSDGPDSQTHWYSIYVYDSMGSNCKGSSGKELSRIYEDSRVTVMATTAQSDQCKKQNLDPQDPGCAKVFITGTFVKVDNTSSEYNFGKEALFEKHPSMRFWPEDHGFFVAKVDPIYIDVFYKIEGGHREHVSKEDYLAADITTLINGASESKECRYFIKLHFVINYNIVVALVSVRATTSKLGPLTMNAHVGLIIIGLFLCGLCGCNVIVPKSPPQPWKTALMARYIMHYSDWLSMATISTQTSIKGYPFVSLKSVSDGPSTKSTGTPYLYMSPLDVLAVDLASDQRVSIMATLAQSDYCRTENFDPQDPRCAKLLITGGYVKVNKSSSEYQFGLTALLDRHPSMKSWPTDHDFYVAKVVPTNIEVLDYFGV